MNHVEDGSSASGKRRRHGGTRRLVVLAVAIGVGILGAVISPRAVAASTAEAVSSTTSSAVTAVADAASSVMPAAAAVAAPPILPPVGTLGAHGVLPRATELTLSLRLVYASLVGSLVGWERSASNHSAGVRTMSLVSLGAAAFTICSMYGFVGSARFDPSRMASNVASGVGFIGAGVITTHSLQLRQEERKSALPRSIVHGLTTAAAIWISAAVGVASGVGMYYIAGTAALATVSILRIGRVKYTPWGKRVRRQVGIVDRKETLQHVTTRRHMSSELEADPLTFDETHDLSVWDEDEPSASVVRNMLSDNSLHEFQQSVENQTSIISPRHANMTEFFWSDEGVVVHSKGEKEETSSLDDMDSFDEREPILKLEQVVERLKREISNGTQFSVAMNDTDARVAEIRRPRERGSR